MSYRSLYRKWRPLKFNDLVGQEHITKTLKNAIARDNISHAYLFCGPRGTGKTTVAKILARAANCTALKDSEPCGECDSCLNIIAGASMDVFELDAASNRGIDEMRDLKEKTRYMASEGRFKVYIIDEAHMLTNEAFNALLKTLEEPPPGVIFIMATTDPSKLPPTVVSRCQRLDFRLLTATEVEERIRHVASAEEWPFEEEALPLIARLSEGALRDALGFLEQVYAFGEGRITAENVYDLAGLTREETLVRIVEALFNGDVTGGLTEIREVAFGGKDMHLFLKEQIQFFKHLLIYTSGGELDKDYKRYHAHLKSYKDSFSRESLLRFINMLNEAAGKLRLAEHAHFILEITFLNMLNETKRLSLKTNEDLSHKVFELEERLNNLMDKLHNQKLSPVPKTDNLIMAQEEKALTTGEESGTAREVVQEKSPDADSADPGPTDDASGEGAGDTKRGASSELNLLWQGILEVIQKNKQISTQALLQMLQPESIEDELLVLSYEKGNSFLKGKIEEPGRNKLISKVAQEVAGRPLKIKLIERVGNNSQSETGTHNDKASAEGEKVSGDAGEKEETAHTAERSEEKTEFTTDVKEGNKISGNESKPVSENTDIVAATDFSSGKKEETPMEEEFKSGGKSGARLNSEFIISEAKSLFNGKMIENEN